MKPKKTFKPEELRYLSLLAKQYPTVQAASTEIINLQAILNLHPEIVVVDELAQTNIEGSSNTKPWQDVMQILYAGVSVISAVNIQHIEGLNEVVEESTGIESRERVPDRVRARADEVVNIDLTADELIERYFSRYINYGRIFSGHYDD